MSDESWLLHSKKTKQYREWLKIDKDDLDEELIRQPELYAKVALAQVRAVSNRDALKEEEKRLNAELQKEVRARFEKEDIKYTEKSVEAEIRTDSRTGVMSERVLDAERSAAEWQALKEAYIQRSYVLKDLCGLCLAGYWADSAVRGTGPRELSDMKHEKFRKKREEASSKVYNKQAQDEEKEEEDE